jgi:hypothetical protein
MSMSVRDVVSNIDWELFSKQKLRVLVMIDCAGLSKGDVEVMDGIITLMDAIQDAAIDDGLATVEEVFGKTVKDILE